MTDVFRKEHKEISAQRKDDIFVIKSRAETLYNEFVLMELDENVDERMIALAKDNLEQAVMWAIKAIT